MLKDIVMYANLTKLNSHYEGWR